MPNLHCREPANALNSFAANFNLLWNEIPVRPMGLELL
jgi:hypothetical protein